jgi:tellurite resistance protein TerC
MPLSYRSEGVMTHSIGSPLFWFSFLVIVLLLLAVDLGMFHRKARELSARQALLWSMVWALLSLLFGAWVYVKFGATSGLEFFAGYLIEYALSVDNVFVFILIFSYFSVPRGLHHKVLFWGILGALIMRASFILAGTALLSSFHWIMYLFGALLILTGGKIMRQGEAEIEPERNPIIRLFRKTIPMTGDYGSGGFLTKENGKMLATPLFLVLVTVETTDLFFAIDSIPAVFGVTLDPFIVYTSNVCAILGLRSMYFVLAAVIKRFAYLGTGVGIILVFIGIKMLLHDLYEVPISVSLMFLAFILAASVLISILHPPRREGDSSNHPPPLVTSNADEE